MYETLREAREYASQQVDNEYNFHIAECFALKYQQEYQPGMNILRKQDLTNVYVLFRV